jgi:hypothetical protein
MGRLVSALALATAVGIAGCGGSGGETTETVTTDAVAAISKAQFIERADEVCGNVQEAFEPFEKELNEAEGFPELEAALENVLPAVERARDRITSIPIPAENGTGAEAYASYVTKAVTLLEQLQEAAENEDRSALETYSEDLRVAGARAQGAAAAYGFKVCGQE